MDDERERLAGWLEQRCFFESNGIGCDREEYGPCNYCRAAALLREPMPRGFVAVGEPDKCPGCGNDSVYRYCTHCRASVVREDAGDVWHRRWVEYTKRVGTMVLSQTRTVRDIGSAILADMAQVEKDVPFARQPTDKE